MRNFFYAKIMSFFSLAVISCWYHCAFIECVFRLCTEHFRKIYFSFLQSKKTKHYFNLCMINESECAFWIVCICYKVRRYTHTHHYRGRIGWLVFFSVCQTKLKRILCLNHHERCDIFLAINCPYYFVFWFTWIIKEFVKMLNEFNVAHDFYLCMHLRCSSLSGRLSHCLFFSLSHHRIRL